MTKFTTLALASICLAAGAAGFAISPTWAESENPSKTSPAEKRGDHAGDDQDAHAVEAPNDGAHKDHDQDDGHDHEDQAPDGKDGHHAQDGHRHDDGRDQEGGQDTGGKEGHDHGSEDSPGHGNNGQLSDDGHDDHGSVRLTQQQMDRFGVRTVAVAGGPIPITIERPAEIIYNENALAHVVPRVPGIARTVEANEGDQVAEGAVLAVLDSRELADAKAAYLASLERLALAKDNFDRAEALVGKRIVSEKTHLAAKTDFAEARINLRSARQKLLALGVDNRRLREIAVQAQADLRAEPDADLFVPDDLTTYIMRAPLGGTVVTRHLSRGESVETDREAFIIADVSTVWVDISIYAHDLERVDPGQPVTIETDGGIKVDGTIAFVTPNVSEETRTAIARVEVENAAGNLRPGMFVTAQITLTSESVDVRVPASALLTQEGKSVVFVREGADGRLQTRQVTLGRSNGTYVEVLGGLKPGEAVVAKGAFLVKSQLAKSDFDDGHNH